MVVCVDFLLASWQGRIGVTEGWINTDEVLMLGLALVV